MSWDSYITSLTALDGQEPSGSSHGEAAIGKEPSGSSSREAAICGIKPGEESQWASSSGLVGITPDQVKALCNARLGSTVTLSGIKAMVIRQEEQPIKLLTLTTMKNQTDENMDETRILAIGFSKTAVVIGLDIPGRRKIIQKVLECTSHLSESGY